MTDFYWKRKSNEKKALTSAEASIGSAPKAIFTTNHYYISDFPR